MCPFPGNDHSILPDKWTDKQYLDYGPLLKMMKGREWVLTENPVIVEGGIAKANLFQVPDGYIVPVVFGEKDTATIRVVIPAIKNNLKVLVQYPGEKTTSTIKNEIIKNGELFLDRGGYRFVQWSVSFDNVTSDLTVTPVYVDISGGTTAAAAAIAPAAAPAAPAPAPTTTVIPETSAPAAAPSASASSSASPGTETETITGEQTPEAAPGGEGIPAWVWALIGVGAAGFLFWLFFWLKKKRKEEEEQGNH